MSWKDEVRRFYIRFKELFFKDYWKEIIKKEKKIRDKAEIGKISKLSVGIIDENAKYSYSIESYIKANLPVNIINRVMKIEHLGDVSISLGVANDTLSQLKTNELITQTILRFIPPSIVSIGLALFTMHVSSFIGAWTATLTFFIIFGIMLTSLFVVYSFHNHYIKYIRICEDYTEQLCKKRTSIVEKINGIKIAGVDNNQVKE